MIRTLILDDDEPSGSILADTLRRHPRPMFEPVTTTSLEEARQAVLCAEQPFDLLLIDQMILIIVRWGNRLGFERARLWLASDDEQTLIGAGQAGNAGLDRFEGFRMPVTEAPYARAALMHRGPSFFQGQPDGRGYLLRHFGAYGFDPPVGERAHVPLWAGECCLGLLTLDNASRRQPLRPDQRRLLGLFGRQSRCWLGVPLRVGGRAVGAITVQSYDRERAYTEQDLRLLLAVADQLAGAIQAAHVKERQAEVMHQPHMLYRASLAMMKLAEDDRPLSS